MTFTLAMVKNPRVWKRAQAEIDVVVGIDRLPEFEHRSSLSYVDQSCEKHFDGSPLLRWVSVWGEDFSLKYTQTPKVSRTPLRATTFTTVCTYPKVSFYMSEIRS